MAFVSQPLADLLRPKDLEGFVGQGHLVGKNGLIRKLLEKGAISSFLFWGPPGCGKTTLARLMATRVKADFVEYSAVTAKKADITKVAVVAKDSLKAFGRRTILFIDEIHRFNKAQQDAFLPFVEDGTVILFGATTENPSFSVIAPLLSRCRVVVLQRLNETELLEICRRGEKFLEIGLTAKARSFLVELTDGDARQVLNILEIVAKMGGKKKKIDEAEIAEAAQKKALAYDKNGEEHYNTISAFIKSMRASDVDAAVYYLARMIEAGEDPLFIARRMVIFASEDVGMAQPTALVVANEVFRAVETIGYPECAINLAQGVVYLTKAPKNRSAYEALRAAQVEVRQSGSLPIPLFLRNAPTALMKELGYGKGYDLPADARYQALQAGKYPGKEKSLLPERLAGKIFFR